MPVTPRGLPYPTPDDPVALGANDIRALAEAVDALKALGYWYSPSEASIKTDDNAYVAGYLFALAGHIYLGAANEGHLYTPGAGMVGVASLQAEYNVLSSGGFFRTPGYANMALYGPAVAGVGYQAICGSTVVTTDDNGAARIAFPAAVVAVLSVVACNGDDDAAGGVSVNVRPPDTTGFGVRLYGPAGGFFTGPARVNWHAIIQL
jgi:hypothetical protein